MTPETSQQITCALCRKIIDPRRHFWLKHPDIYGVKQPYHTDCYLRFCNLSDQSDLSVPSDASRSSADTPVRANTPTPTAPAAPIPFAPEHISIDHIRSAAEWAIAARNTPLRVGKTTRQYDQETFDCKTTCCIWGAAMHMMGPSSELSPFDFDHALKRWSRQSSLHSQIATWLLRTDTIPEDVIAIIDGAMELSPLGQNAFVRGISCTNEYINRLAARQIELNVLLDLIWADILALNPGIREKSVQANYDPSIVTIKLPICSIAAIIDAVEGKPE
jgi:hypothetical protein